VRALGRLLYRGRRSEVRPVLRRTSLRVCVETSNSKRLAKRSTMSLRPVLRRTSQCVCVSVETSNSKRLAKRSTVSLCPVLRRTSLRVRQPYLEAQSVQVQDAVPIRLTTFGSSTGRGNDLVKRSKGQRVMAIELSQKTSSVNSTGSYKSPAKSWNDQSQYVNSR